MVPITTWVAVPLLSPAPRAPSRPLLPPGPGPLPEADTEESQASEKSEASPSSTERENRGGPVSLDAVQAGPQAGGPYHAATKGGTRPPQRPAFVSHVEQQNATQVASEGWAHRLSPPRAPGRHHQSITAQPWTRWPQSELSLHWRRSPRPSAGRQQCLRRLPDPAEPSSHRQPQPDHRSDTTAFHGPPATSRVALRGGQSAGCYSAPWD